MTKSKNSNYNRTKKNSHFDQTKKFKLWQIKKMWQTSTQIVTKLYNSNCDKSLKKIKYLQNSTQIVTVVSDSSDSSNSDIFFRKTTSTPDEMFLVQLFAILAMFLVRKRLKLAADPPILNVAFPYNTVWDWTQRLRPEHDIF